jgi:hypothetical protein
MVKKMAVFWVAALCRMVEIYRRFRGDYYLHHQGDGQAAGDESVPHRPNDRGTSETSVNLFHTTRRKTQETAIFMLAAVRT